MNAGTIFFDKDFVFHDGEHGEKLLVILASGNGIALAVKTTSNSKRHRLDYGCQSDARFPCFHLPMHSCCLSKPTWLCLNEFYELRYSDLLQKHFSAQINRIGELAENIVRELLECALASEDISSHQEGIVRKVLATI